MNFDDNKTLKENIIENFPELSLLDNYERSINNFLDFNKTYEEYKELASQVKEKFVFLTQYFSTYNEKIKQHFSQDVNLSFEKNKKTLTIGFNGIQANYENNKISFDFNIGTLTLEELEHFDKIYLKFREDINKFNDNHFFESIFEDFDLLNDTISKLKIIFEEYNLNANIIKNKNKRKTTQLSKLFKLAKFNSEREFVREQISNDNWKATDDSKMKMNFVTYRFENDNVLFTTHTLKIKKENDQLLFNLNGNDTDNFIDLVNNSFYIDNTFINNKGAFRNFDIKLSTNGRIQYKQLIEKLKLKIQQQNIVDF